MPGPVGLSRYVGPKPPKVDADAADYFSRAETLGGSFDLTAVNAAFTETYTKNKITTYIQQLKVYGIWDKLTELYLLSIVSFDGLMAKLKYDTVPTLTNNGFVEADYLAVGSGAGLKGDRSSYLDTSFYYDSFPLGLMAYLTDIGTKNAMLGASDGGFDDSTTDMRNTGGSIVTRISNKAVAILPSTGAYSPGLFTTFRESSTLMIAHKNGTSKNTVTTSVPLNIPSDTLTVMARSGGVLSDGRIVFGGPITNLTDTEALKLSTFTNQLMAAFGANVY